MPAAKRNLMVVLLQERVNIEDTQEIFRSLVQCIAHLHESKKIHADLKPLNALRMQDRTWRLIDFDATVSMGTPAGTKTSTAYCPPEFTYRSSSSTDDEQQIRLKLPEVDHATGSVRKPANAEYELLPAGASSSRSRRRT